jgi:hypothetical protein
LDGRELEAPVEQAARLLATVLGQDLEHSEGVFRIARRVAREVSDRLCTRSAIS